MEKSASGAAKQPAAHNLPSVTPHLVCAGAAEAIEFYKEAFGAEEMIRLPGSDGKLLHACVNINGSPVMLVDEFPDMGSTGPNSLGGSPVSIHLNVDDSDAWLERAEKAGAIVVMPVEEMFWGDRYGVVKDPFGHVWSLSTPVRKLTEEQLREAARSATAKSCG